MKRVLITAGPVYSSLDSNKIILPPVSVQGPDGTVTNRSRGIWAVKFAHYLLAHGHEVTLLVPDTFEKDRIRPAPPGTHLAVIQHQGYDSYRKWCRDLAPQNDAMVLAAAVANWIPQNPIEGKMPTKGYKEGDVINIPFILAPHVINEMKALNPKLTLIGCKMLVNAPEEDLIEAAYGVLLTAHCNAVVANDMGLGLRRKLVVNQDRTVQVYEDGWEGLFKNLRDHIEDVHYHTHVTR